jgi:hypothetical protein
MAHKIQPPNTLPTAAEVEQLRAFLARAGVPPRIANELVKASRTRKEKADLIRAYFRDLPKDKP